MSQFLFVYHGGEHPQTEQEIATVMGQWGQWLDSLGANVVDSGSPVGLSKTILPDGAVVDNGGSNPVAGYGIVTAKNIDDAINKAQSCPHLQRNGTVEIAEIIELNPQ